MQVCGNVSEKGIDKYFNRLSTILNDAALS